MVARVSSRATVGGARCFLLELLKALPPDPHPFQAATVQRLCVVRQPYAALDYRT